jgi:V/A-type H+-transporting ATPase subunit E
METKNITLKILEDAKKRANEIVAEAEEKVKIILENARDDVQRIEKQLEQEAEESARKERTRILSLAEMEEKRRILGAKITILEEVFRQALDSLKSQSDNDYQKTMRGLLLTSVDHGDEEVVVSKSDKNRLNQEFLNTVNQKLREMGKTGELRLAEESGDFNGGVLLRKDRVETLCSLEVLQEMLRDDLEIEIANLLFQPRE